MSKQIPKGGPSGVFLIENDTSLSIYEIDLLFYRDVSNKD